jgi:hypothetical protein
VRFRCARPGRAGEVRAARRERERFHRHGRPRRTHGISIRSGCGWRARSHGRRPHHPMSDYWTETRGRTYGRRAPRSRRRPLVRRGQVLNRKTGGIADVEIHLLIVTTPQRGLPVCASCNTM